MKTKFKSRVLLVSGGFFLALLLNPAALYAEDRAIDEPAIQTIKESTSKRTQEPMRPDNTRDTAPLVGPSGEEIHDLLYPAPENPDFVTSAN